MVENNDKNMQISSADLLKNPQASIDDILAVMPGPDFPGGGQIITPAADIRQIYLAGRGSLRVRARYHFEEMQRGMWQLVVDELPPAASAELVLSQIEELTNPEAVFVRWKEYLESL